jgi:hypothetical protein
LQAAGRRFCAQSKSAQAELELVLPRGDAQHSVKGLSEGTLVAEAHRNGHVCDEMVFILKRIARRLNPQLQNERLRSDSEGLHKFAM